jgi:hypothetical protein
MLDKPSTGRVREATVTASVAKLPTLHPNAVGVIAKAHTLRPDFGPGTVKFTTFTLLAVVNFSVRSTGKQW